MSRTRWIVVVGVSAVLLGLAGWQVARERKVAACTEAGGVWIAERSRCMPALKPLIRRDLQRS
jgi:hypothetical protein